MEPLVQCQVLPPPCEFLGEAKFPSHHWNLLPSGSLGRRCASALALGPPILKRAPGIGQNQIPEPASSIGSQGSNIPFREDVVKSAIWTTVSVTNGHPSVLPPGNSQC